MYNEAKAKFYNVYSIAIHYSKVRKTAYQKGKKFDLATMFSNLEGDFVELGESLCPTLELLES